MSLRRFEEFTEALWGTPVSSGSVSRLGQEIFWYIEAWRNAEISGISTGRSSRKVGWA
jgi:putative transposase